MFRRQHLEADASMSRSQALEADASMSRRKVLAAGFTALGASGAYLALGKRWPLPVSAAQGAKFSTPTARGPFRAVNSNIVDQSGKAVYLTSVNWFGMETQTYCPHGLWARNWQSMLDQIASTGFNSIRLPYSNQAFESGSTPNGIDFVKNPDLQNLTGIEIMDRIVHGAGQRGLVVILDRHRPDASGQSPLWYTDHVSEDRWISDWVMLAQRYRNEPSVIGADLHNEPHSPATWGDGNVKTDWRLAAERAGNAILQANPNWLIVVEGTDQYNGDGYWWGGNLMGARQFPVRLSHQDKLVYSAHDYGPGVWGQSWFSAPNFPNNLPSVWHSHWAYLVQEGIAPVWLGEFGGRSMGTDTEGVWQRSLVTYLKQNRISYSYWCWNPNSGDTGGILEDDWQTVNKAKMDILSAYQWPLLAQPTSSASQAASNVKKAYCTP
jgi:endoglucanase